jgi:hypothetical protein
MNVSENMKEKRKTISVVFQMSIKKIAGGAKEFSTSFCDFSLFQLWHEFPIKLSN